MAKRTCSFRVQNREEKVMSTATPSPSLHPTRRQLDELDALMERMLEVPVKAAEGESREETNPSPSSPESSTESSLQTDFVSAGFQSYRTEEVDSQLGESASAFAFNAPASKPDTSGAPIAEN